ncbi:MAG: PIN domain-containing protein [Alphaproteobacteria bacterium]|nr:PIN domain-containing protein [Alphaproteobacteria bacterium]
MSKDLLFLDANILFSAAYREHAGLLRFWHLDSVKLISSLYAIEEAIRNLDQLQQKERLKKLLEKVEETGFCHDTLDLPEGIMIREKDKPILLAAIAAQANFLITGDVKDFGKFYGQQISGVMILPPSDYFNSHL